MRWVNQERAVSEARAWLACLTVALCRLVAVPLAPVCGGELAGQTPRATGATGDETWLARAQAIHRRILTLDTHVDIEGRTYATDALDPGIDNPKLQCDLVKMERGGIDAVFLIVYVAQGKRDAHGYAQAMAAARDKFRAIRRLTERYPERCALATSVDELLQIVQSGKRAIAIGVENGYPIGEDLANLRKFYGLGARYITLSHNGHNQICDSCNPRKELGDDPSEHDGLSPFGRRVVAEMNRLGMMIDVSHIAPKSFWDVLEASRAPLIASHSGCRALRDHPRNLSDKQLRALAAHGGVVQVVAVASFLKAPPPAREHAIRRLAERLDIPWKNNRPNLRAVKKQKRRQFAVAMKRIDVEFPRATVQDFVDHIDHAVKVAGIDHVGIGSDFDGGGGVHGFSNHAEAPRVTAELLRRGYTESQIAKIWAGNLLRVWRQAEAVAAKLQKPAPAAAGTNEFPAADGTPLAQHPSIALCNGRGFSKMPAPSRSAFRRRFLPHRTTNNAGLKRLRLSERGRHRITCSFAGWTSLSVAFLTG
ncbi:MAG: membrane dipeptidase [Planctomycetes bacterium]|nr:membrane dipeptidase [Planctomycetota bacterium]